MPIRRTPPPAASSPIKSTPPPASTGSSNRDSANNVYNLTTLPRLIHSATPTGRNELMSSNRKRFKPDDPLPHDASFENLEAKIDILTATMAKFDDHIKNILDDNQKMHSDLLDIMNLLKSHLSSNATKSSSIVPINKKSYANTLKSSDVVIVQPNIEQSCKATRDALILAVNPVETGVCGSINGVNGKIVIECQSNADPERVKQIVDSALGDGYEVKAPKKRKPLLRVYGLRDDMPEADFLDALIKQNCSLLPADPFLRVTRKFQVKKSDGPRYGYKMEVDPESFKLLIEAGKVSIGWDKLWVNEEFLLLRCFNCWGFHHTSKNCTSNKKCYKCGEAHNEDSCDSVIEKCCVCSTLSESRGLNLNVNHSAKNLQCPSYLRKIELEKRTVNYI